MPLILEKYREQGREEGAHSNALKTAQKMLDKGCELDFISEISGLSMEEIKQLQKK